MAEGKIIDKRRLMKMGIFLIPSLIIAVFLTSLANFGGEPEKQTFWYLTRDVVFGGIFDDSDLVAVEVQFDNIELFDVYIPSNVPFDEGTAVVDMKIGLLNSSNFELGIINLETEDVPINQARVEQLSIALGQIEGYDSSQSAFQIVVASEKTEHIACVSASSGSAVAVAIEDFSILNSYSDFPNSMQFLSGNNCPLGAEASTLTCPNPLRGPPVQCSQAPLYLPPLDAIPN